MSETNLVTIQLNGEKQDFILNNKEKCRLEKKDINATFYASKSVQNPKTNKLISFLRNCLLLLRAGCIFFLWVIIHFKISRMATEAKNMKKKNYNFLLCVNVRSQVVPDRLAKPWTIWTPRRNSGASFWLTACLGSTTRVEMSTRQRLELASSQNFLTK